MGQAALKFATTLLGDLEVKPDQDSISEPGQKSATSASIKKELYLDFEGFFEEICVHSRTPVSLFDAPFVKDVVYTDHGPNESECKVVLDGKRLKKVKRQEGDEDKIAVWVKTHIDPEKKSLSNELMWPEGCQSSHNAMLHFNAADETFTMESWQIKDGVRDAGREWADMVSNFYLKPHMLTRHYFKKVTVAALQPAPDQPNLRIALSSSLEEFYSSPEDLLDALEGLLKKHCKELGGSVDYDEETEDALLSQVLEINEVKVPIVFIMRSDQEKKHLSVKLRVGADADADQVVLYTNYWQAYEAPLRLGLWTEREGGSMLGGYLEATEASWRLNKLVSERDVMKDVEQMSDDVFF